MIILVVVVLAVLVYVWWVRRGLAGYWRGGDNSMYLVEASKGQYRVLRGDEARPLTTGGVTVALGDRRGWVELDGRRINWDDGEVWVRQGI